MKTTKGSSSRRAGRPALSPEARENQMISYAEDLAEQQMLDGTASPSIIVHYLKLGALKEKTKLELAKLEAENKLLTAKTDSINASRQNDQLYQDAIDAMRRYSGRDSSDDY